MGNAAEYLRDREALYSASAAASGDSACQVELIASRSGDMVPRLQNLYLESRYDPRRDAERRAGRLDLEGKRAVILLGDGGYYLARHLVQHFSGTVLVIEPSPALAFTMLRSLGAEAFTGFQLVFSEELSSPGDFAPHLPVGIGVNDVAVTEHQPSLRLFEESCRRAGELLIAFLQRSVANLQTLAHFGRRWLFNILDNSTVYARKRQGKPVRMATGACWVIAVPGPGLDELLDKLQAMRSRYRLLALTPALRQLAAAGIRPDLVCSMDGGWANALHTAGAECDIPLVAAWYTSATLVRRWPGPLLPVSLGLGLEARLFQNGLTLPERPTVAGMALDIAVKLGARKILLAGQDFGYREGKDHCREYRFLQDRRSSMTRVRPLAMRSPYAWASGKGALAADPKMEMYSQALREQIAGLSVDVSSWGDASCNGLPERDPTHFPSFEDCAFGEEEVQTPAIDREYVAASLKALKEFATRKEIQFLLRGTHGRTDAGGYQAFARIFSETPLRPIWELLRPLALFNWEQGDIKRAMEDFGTDLPLELRKIRDKFQKTLNRAR